MVLDRLETKLEGVSKKLPKLPENTRKSLAGALWWLAGLVGLLQLWLAWRLWDVAHWTSQLDTWVDAVNRYYGTRVVDDGLGFFYYAAFVVLLASAALYLVAVPGLKAHKRKLGWNLVFYALLVQLVYGILIAFTRVYGGLGDFLWALVTAAIVAYFLFQVRDKFSGGKHEHHEETKK